MLGVSFPELAVFLAVALVVLGPEKAIKASRSMGRAFSRIRSYLHECERELDLKEVREEASALRGNMLDFRAAAARGLDEAKDAAGSKMAASQSPSGAPKAGAARTAWPKPPAYAQDEQIKALEGRVAALEHELSLLKGQGR